MRNQSPNRLIQGALLCLLCACSPAKQSDQQSGQVSKNVAADTKKGFAVKVRAPLFMPDAGAQGQPSQTLEAPDALLGEWVLDKEAVKSSKLFKAIPKDQIQSAGRPLGSKVTLRITKNDISMSGVFLDRPKSGCWLQINRQEGNNFVAQLLVDGQKRQQRFLVRGQKLVIRMKAPLFFTRSETSRSQSKENVAHRRCMTWPVVGECQWPDAPARGCYRAP